MRKLMRKLLAFYRGTIIEYKDFRHDFSATQSKICMFANVFMFIYSLAAPYLLRNIASYSFELLREEFSIISIMFGTMLVLCILGKYKFKSEVFNDCVTILTVCAGFGFSCISVYYGALSGRDASYVIFMLASFLTLSLFYIYPVIFFGLYATAIVATVIEASMLVDAGLSIERAYNMIVFAIAGTCMMVYKYNSGIKNFRQRTQIEHLQKQSEQFMAQITHEMRTPLNAVLGKNQLIGKITKEEETKSLSDEIANSGRLLLSLINDVLDLSKLQSGKMTIVPSGYDISGMAYDIVSIMKSEAEGHGLRLNINFDPALPAKLYGDEIRLKQIIMNLLSNAIKYTREGSVTFNIQFHKLDEKVGMVKVSIKDTGIGIKAEDIPKLAQSYVRFDQQVNRNTQGTGLGLSITCTLLNMMNSKLDISSIYGAGSTFSFELKQEIIDATPGGGRKRNMSQKPFNAPDAKVLVVDDNKINYTVCRGLMKFFGVDPEYAGSGAECLSKLKTNTYDIVFLDHMMPEMDGIQTLDAIKSGLPEVYESTPVIALTANEASDAERVYRELGFSDYLPKPMESAVLERLLRKFIPKEKQL